MCFSRERDQRQDGQWCHARRVGETEGLQWKCCILHDWGSSPKRISDPEKGAVQETSSRSAFLGTASIDLFTDASKFHEFIVHSYGQKGSLDNAILQPDCSRLVTLHQPLKVCAENWTSSRLPIQKEDLPGTYIVVLIFSGHFLSFLCVY